MSDAKIEKMFKWVSYIINSGWVVAIYADLLNIFDAHRAYFLLP